MQRLLWILLVVETCLLVHAVVQRRGFQRRHAPMPWYMAGTEWSIVAMMLLIINMLVDSDRPVAVAALAGSFACLALGTGQAVVAWRRRA
jgi:hypothetical protein